MNEQIQTSFREGLLRLGLEPAHVTLDFQEGIACLTGELEKWTQVVDVGHMAAKLDGVKNVVCNMTSRDKKEAPKRDLAPYYAMDQVGEADVVIIGGGVIGCAIARQLSKYQLKIMVVEKEEDIACGTTKANNGMVHSGYDSKPTSLKAKLNVRGNAMYTQWAKELGFHFNRTGSFVLSFDDAETKTLENLLENGRQNGVPGIELITGAQAREIEPGISPEALYALWTPSAGYAEPYEVALALAENAVDNGARFLLGCEVLDFVKEDGRIRALITNKGRISCGHIINAAGLYADEIARLAGDQFYSIHPRRGTLVIFDKENRGKIHTFSGQAPGPYTKGGGPQETPEGTLLWGPSAKEVWDKEDLDVDADDFDFVVNKGMHLIKGVTSDSVITYFSGNRAATYMEDFIIENSGKITNFTHVAGIQSPGFASAPAIAQMTEELFLTCWGEAAENPTYNPRRAVTKPFRECSAAEREALIRQDPRYGRIICRCETVTEAEIVNAIHGKVPALNMDAFKRRTRAGMGRCQGGFCGARVLDILARELKISRLDVSMKGQGSELLVKNTRQVKRDA